MECMHSYGLTVYRLQIYEVKESYLIDPILWKQKKENLELQIQQGNELSHTGHQSQII